MKFAASQKETLRHGSGRGLVRKGESISGSGGMQERIRGRNMITIHDVHV